MENKKSGANASFNGYQFVELSAPQKTESNHDTLDWMMGLLMAHDLHEQYLHHAMGETHDGDEVYEVIGQVKMTIPELMDFRDKAKRHLNYAFHLDEDVVEFHFWVEIETVRQVPITFELDEAAEFWVATRVLIDYDGGLKETPHFTKLSISVDDVEITDERYYEKH